MKLHTHGEHHPGLDFHEPRVKDSFRLYLRDCAPNGYDSWLDRNLSEDDPVARAWKVRDGLPFGYRSSTTYKCWHDRCLHYIYGFLTQDERDQHVKEHSVLLKRDSGLSVSSTPPMAFADQAAHRRDLGSENSKRSPYLYLPPLTASLQLTIPPTPGFSREHKDSLRSYSLAAESAAPARDLRGSIDSEVDPLLPPLKRSRVGQSKLESIGELRLLREAGSCLQCRISRQVVSTASHLLSIARLLITQIV